MNVAQYPSRRNACLTALLDGTMLSGSLQRIGGFKHGLYLPGTEFNFERQQWQARCLGGVLHDAHGLVCHVGPLFRPKPGASQTQPVAPLVADSHATSGIQARW